MHILQKKLLDLAGRHNLAELKLREIAELLDEPNTHPQQIKHHLLQLQKKGLITLDKKKKLIEKVREASTTGTFFAVPILGAANCGEAMILADERIEGYLMLSKGMLQKRRGVFALRAIGSSMNKADVKGKTINEGDFVIVDGDDRDVNNCDYVVSIINGAANIKKFVRDEKNNQIALVSESTQEFPPIYIHLDDFDSSYAVAGKVLQVIKKPPS